MPENLGSIFQRERTLSLPNALAMGSTSPGAMGVTLITHFHPVKLKKLEVNLHKKAKGAVLKPAVLPVLCHFGALLTKSQ